MQLSSDTLPDIRKAVTRCTIKDEMCVRSDIFTAVRLSKNADPITDPQHVSKFVFMRSLSV